MEDKKIAENFVKLNAKLEKIIKNFEDLKKAEVKEILRRRVQPFGNGAHISMSRKLLNHDTIIHVLHPKKEEEK